MRINPISNTVAFKSLYVSPEARDHFNSSEERKILEKGEKVLNSTKHWDLYVGTTESRAFLTYTFENNETGDVLSEDLIPMGNPPGQVSVTDLNNKKSVILDYQGDVDKAKQVHDQMITYLANDSVSKWGIFMQNVRKAQILDEAFDSTDSCVQERK